MVAWSTIAQRNDGQSFGGPNFDEAREAIFELQDANGADVPTVPVAVQLNDAVCKVSRLSTGQSVSSGSATVLTWTHANLDPLGWSQVGGANPGRVTPTIAGWYEVTAWSAHSGTTVGIERRQILILRNGATLPGLEGVADIGVTPPTAQAAFWGLTAGPTLVQLNGSSEFVESRVFHVSSGGVARETFGSMLVRLVRAT